MSVFCPSNDNSPFAPWNQEEPPLFYADSEGHIYTKVFLNQAEDCYGDKDLTIPVKAVFYDDFHDAVIDGFSKNGFSVCILKIDLQDGKVCIEMEFENSLVAYCLQSGT